MVIDFHTHTFPDPIAPAALGKLSALSHTTPFTDGTASGLSHSSRRAGIDLSIVLPVATRPSQVETINNSAAQLNRHTAETGLFSFGCIHPDFTHWYDELARVAQLGLKGIKIHPVYQETALDDLRYLRILNRAAELGLTVITHTGLDIGYPEKAYCTPAMARSVLRQVGPMKLILAHMGGWRRWDEAAELLADASALLDTSFSLGTLSPLNDGYYRADTLALLTAEQFCSMVHIFGAERILFGSDSPWGDQAADVQQIRSLPLSFNETHAILGGNAQRILNLNR